MNLKSTGHPLGQPVISPTVETEPGVRPLLFTIRDLQSINRFV